MDNAKNFAKVTVDGTYDDTETSVNVIAFDGAKLPTVPFNAVWWNATDYPDPADDPSVEIVRVTAISTDTLTVARGEEGPSPGTGFEHALEGKLYRMVAGLTAKSINDDLYGSGASTLELNPASGITRLGDIDGAGNNSKMILDDNSAGSPTGSLAQFGCGGQTVVGDLDGTGVGQIIDAPNGILKNFGQLGTDQSASATVGVGLINGKMPIYLNDGTLIGYIPIYATIT